MLRLNQLYRFSSVSHCLVDPILIEQHHEVFRQKQTQFEATHGVCTLWSVSGLGRA
jgi:hypothetical protein